MDLGGRGFHGGCPERGDCMGHNGGAKRKSRRFGRPLPGRRARTPRVATVRDGPPNSLSIPPRARRRGPRSEEHTSELQSRQYLVCRLLLEKKKKSPAAHYYNR